MPSWASPLPCWPSSRLIGPCLETGNALIKAESLTYHTVVYGETDPDAGPPEDTARLPRWYRIDGESHDGRTWGGLRWLQDMLNE